MYIYYIYTCIGRPQCWLTILSNPYESSDCSTAGGKATFSAATSTLPAKCETAEVAGRLFFPPMPGPFGAPRTVYRFTRLAAEAPRERGASRRFLFFAIFGPVATRRMFLLLRRQLPLSGRAMYA